MICMCDICSNFIDTKNDQHIQVISNNGNNIYICNSHSSDYTQTFIREKVTYPVKILYYI